MTTGLFHLLRRTGNLENSRLTLHDLSHWQIPENSLPLEKTEPFLSIHCPGCEEACPMQVIKHASGPFIFCNKPQDLGKISLTSEDVTAWRLNIAEMAGILATYISGTAAKEINKGRIYDLGIMEEHTVLLVRGLSWPDGEKLLKQSGIMDCNPVLVYIGTIPEHITLPKIDLALLLSFCAGKLEFDKEKLALIIRQGKPAEGNCFQKVGDSWRVRFEGKETSLRHSNGMTYIQHLLYHPKKSLAPIELQALHNKQDTTQILTGNTAHAMWDEKTIGQVMQRILHLQTTYPDSKEIPELQAQLGKATHQGQSISFTTIQEKARSAVAHAISTAIKNIKKEHDALGNHLKNCIRGGVSCSYTPEENIRWL